MNCAPPPLSDQEKEVAKGLYDTIMNLHTDGFEPRDIARETDVDERLVGLLIDKLIPEMGIDMLGRLSRIAGFSEKAREARRLAGFSEKTRESIIHIFLRLPERLGYNYKP